MQPRLTRAVRTALAAGLIAGGVTATARRRHGGRLRVLMYHGVLPRVTGPAAYGDLFVSVDDFARHMRHVQRRYQVMSLEAVAAGDAWPERAVVITFDDGYRNTISAALPVLTALRLPATVFVPTDLAGGGDGLWFDALRLLVAQAAAQRRRIELMPEVVIDGLHGGPEARWAALSARIMELPPDAHQRAVDRLLDACRAERLFERHPEFALASWDEWRRAVSGGSLSVGAHGCRHEHLLHLPHDTREPQLRASRLRIEDELSRPCRTLAYPYGLYDDATLEAARTAGYACAVTIDDGLNEPGQPLLRLCRTMVGDKGSPALFRARVSGAWDGLRGIRASTGAHA